MNHTERFSFDQKTQEILEQMSIPFAIYQYIDKRVVTIALSQGFCDEFGFKNREDAYRLMDSDMYRATHPDERPGLPTPPTVSPRSMNPTISFTAPAL